MKKLKLETFRISKLTNSQTIIGGTGSVFDAGDTQTEDRDKGLIKCTNKSRKLVIA